METRPLKLCRAYEGSCIVLSTKHAKSGALSAPFWNTLKASMIECPVDTDLLGSFPSTGSRAGNAIECARRKCQMSLRRLGEKVKFVLASEGSFGPHPFLAGRASDFEVLYFIDREHGFQLHLSCLSAKTNFAMKAVGSMEELREFAAKALFPAHGLILRPNRSADSNLVFKGVDSEGALESAFRECVKHSADRKAWVETDMRAMFNPTRMEVIAELGGRLAERLAALCPKCSTPGWGSVRLLPEMDGGECAGGVEVGGAEVHGCVKCGYEERMGSGGLVEGRARIW